MNPMRLSSLLLALILAAPFASAQTSAAPAAAPAQTHRASPTSGGARNRHEAAARVHETPSVLFSAYNDHPKLAIILVIDQFRGDYLDRWRTDFKGRGFDLFLDHGAYFPNCYYDYANTKTAPGHATIGTGAYTDGHGISSNEWWDLRRNQQRPVTSVEDERYKLVGVPASSMPANAQYVTGSSPRNLMASTIGDELRLATQGQSKVFGVSLKDRASILPAGSTANAAYWIDPASGYWVTSTFYMSQLPDWVNQFNSGGAIAQAEQDANATDTKNFFSDVGKTPAANQYELNFAEALIQNEQLGQRDVTDLLTLSLSANDIMGHAQGPDSPDEEQMVDALDTQLDDFSTWLDKNIPGGLGNVWIALTADHGVAPLSATAAGYGLDAAQIDVDKLVAALNYAINMKFSPGEKVQYILPHPDLPYISLNAAEFMKAGIVEQEAEAAVQQALPAAMDQIAPQPPEPVPSDMPNPVSGSRTAAQPSDTRLPPAPKIYRSYTREQLANGSYPPTAWGELLAHSYSPNGGWYIMVIPAAFQMAVMHGTNHFTPYMYDRHVPLGFYGVPFAPGRYLNRVEPVDIAATFAALLGVNMPSAAVGHVLTEALKPATQVAYPRELPHRETTHRPAATAKPGAETAPNSATPAERLPQPGPAAPSSKTPPATSPGPEATAPRMATPSASSPAPSKPAPKSHPQSAPPQGAA
ncbi:MAG TPA: alkaline phosphatase family protein [Acidobacteriaceae bacterium]|nr:alkaline phosphatase family protein [Acidobacteriaceae bacterium]